MDNSLSVGNSSYSKYSSTYIDSETNTADPNDNSYLSFDSYLALLVAQMQNQDFNNPMDDSEVLAQMAQYSMLEGIKNMTQQSAISYATSLVGSVVTVDDGSGAYTGMVESVTVKNGEPWLMIDGMSYKSDKVTDVVDIYTFNSLMSLIGKTVKSKGTEDDDAVMGVVTNVLYKDGEGYVVVNDKLVEVSKIELVGGDKNEGTEGSDKTEDGDKTEGSENVSGTEGEEGTDKGSGSEGSDNIVTETAEAETSAAMSYKAKSQSLIDTFMKELDEAGGVSAVSGVKEAAASSPAGSVSEEYYVEIMELEVPDYGAGVYADDSIITGTVSSNSDIALGSGSGTISKSSEAKSVSSANNYSANYSGYSSYGGYSGVTTSKGVSTSDCVPHRISVENYPEEAALADRLGTRMYDIRFINNRAITSRINTDKIIGHSSSGKPVTEIGYSGVGQLGEVVTFADGTQRVEILMKNGHSGWLTTSGNLTLDEICTRNGAPGSLAGKLTPQESAIRHFSDPMADVNQSLKNSFNSYISRYSV